MAKELVKEINNFFKTNNNQHLFVITEFLGVNKQIADRRLKKQNQLSFVILNGRLFVFCHGCENNAIVVRNGVIKPVNWLINNPTINYWAKKCSNKIYLSCCYGGIMKELELNGIKIIPVNYSSKPVISVGKTKFYVELWEICDMQEFNKFYNNVLKILPVKAVIIKTQEEDIRNVLRDFRLGKGGETTYYESTRA